MPLENLNEVNAEASPSVSIKVVNVMEETDHVDLPLGQIIAQSVVDRVNEN